MVLLTLVAPRLKMSGEYLMDKLLPFREGDSAHVDSP